MKKYIHIIASELFHASLILYAVLLTVETFRPGSVSAIFDPAYLLIVTVVSGIITGMVQEESGSGIPETYHRLNAWDLVYLFTISAAGAVFVYIRTVWLGAAAVFISIISSALIFVFSYISLTEPGE